MCLYAALSLTCRSQGKGLVVWRKRIEPIFKAAGCQIDLTITTHNGHAYDLAKTLALDYDAVVTVSGDGLIHEVRRIDWPGTPCANAMPNRS